MSDAGAPVYLDNAATTLVDPRVVQGMLPWLSGEDGFGNPASGHSFGRRAAAMVEAAREEVAALVNAQPQEIVWTSGATEANNLAILGAARFYSRRGRHLITVRSEHKSVLEPYAQLAKEGFELTVLEVLPDGRLDLQALSAALRPDTLLVSVMYVNNETGVVQPLQEIAQCVKGAGALLHVDAVQAAGRLPIDLAQLPADLLTLSAHKMYGPKGVGALYVRRQPRVRLSPPQLGGGQEGGLRPGTVPTHQVAGMGEAARLARLELAADAQRLAALKQRLWQGLQTLEGVRLNGRLDGAPHILNAAFIGVHGEALAAELDAHLAVSGSSACTAAQGSASHVLRAMGVPEQLAHSSLRLSLGRFTTEQDIGGAVQILATALRRLRAFSPVWRTYTAGVALAELYGPMTDAQP
jgi:cysteine desulfurase